MKLADDYKQRYVGLLGRYFDEVEGYIVGNYLNRMGQVVVDLGSGTGRLIPLLRQHQKDVLAVDLSLDDLSISKDYSGNDVIFACADGAKLPIGNSEIDAVLAMGIYQHVPDLLPHLVEVDRILKSDGIFVFSVWNKRPLLHLPGLGLDRNQVAYDVSRVIKALGDAGFDAVEVRSTFFMPRRIFWGIGKILGRTPLYRVFIEFSIWFERYMASSPRVGLRGWELLFVARKS